jgi:hypothetical protein
MPTIKPRCAVTAADPLGNERDPAVLDGHVPGRVDAIFGIDDVAAPEQQVIAGRRAQSQSSAQRNEQQPGHRPIALSS